MGLVWTQQLEKKSFAGDRTPVVQSIVRQYTDWATPALQKGARKCFNFEKRCYAGYSFIENNTWSQH
jgi:hypothetical protein